MKESMLKTLKTLNNAVTVEELISLMDDVSVKEIEEVQKLLNEMVQKFEIYYTNRGNLCQSQRIRIFAPSWR